MSFPGWIAVKAFRVHAAVAWLLLTTVGFTLISALTVPVGVLVNNHMSAYVSVFLLEPVLLVVGILWTVRAPISAWERLSRQPIGRWQVGAPVCAALTAAGLVVGSTQSMPGGITTATLRNLAGVLGLSLITWPLLGEFAWSAGLLFMAGSVLFGLDDHRQPARWAWPIAAGSDQSALVLAAGLLVVGLVVIAWAGRRS